MMRIICWRGRSERYSRGRKSSVQRKCYKKAIWDKHSRVRGVIGLWYNYNRTQGKKLISEADRLVVQVIW